MALIPRNTEIPKCFKVTCYCIVIGEQYIFYLIAFKIEMKIVVEISKKVKIPWEGMICTMISLAEDNAVLSSVSKISDFLLTSDFLLAFSRWYHKAKCTTANSSSYLQNINLCPYMLKAFLITHYLISPSWI